MHYVYLDTKNNKLIISYTKIDNSDFHLFMFNDGNYELSLSLCKTFCIGYIIGKQNELEKPINDINEFKS